MWDMLVRKIYIMFICIRVTENGRQGYLDRYMSCTSVQFCTNVGVKKGPWACPVSRKKIWNFCLTKCQLKIQIFIFNSVEGLDRQGCILFICQALASLSKKFKC